MASRGYTLIYGGANVGLMGVLARTSHEHGGKVVGVIPEALRDRELAYTDADELIVTSNLRDRKKIMEERADAFLALPGGFGTLEEVVEEITLRQLGLHDKPVVLLNTDGYFDPLLRYFDHIFAERFAPQHAEELYRVASGAQRAFELLEADL